MAVKRYFATKDTSVANYDPAMLTNDSIADSNVGASEILNLYNTTYNNTTQSLAHIYIDFPTPTRPVSSSLWLKMFNAQHADALPYGYYVDVRPLEQLWSEGNGHDMDYYTDIGYASFNSATLSTPRTGLTGSSSASFFFETGHEDLEVDISDLSSTFGYTVRVSDAHAGDDVYIKKFHSRQTHFQIKRPYIEVRWDDSTVNLSTETKFLVTADGPWNGTYVDLAYETFMSGTIVEVTSALTDPTGALNIKIYDLKQVYDVTESPTLHMYVQVRDLQQSAVAHATADTSGAVLLDAYYSVIDDHTGEVVLPFGTGTLKYTKMSCNDSGNYFYMPMCNFPRGNIYRIEVGYNINSEWSIYSGEEFKFRVR